MPMYAMLSTLGPGGWETLREKPERIREVTAEVEALGLKVHAQYALMGQYDFLNIIEAPDEETMAKAAIMLASRGTMRTTTLPAIPVEQLIARLKPTARPYGSGRGRSDPPGAAAVLLAQVGLGEGHRQDRAVGAAADLVHRLARARVVDAVGDLESARPLRLEAAPDLDACAGSHLLMVRRVSSGPDVRTTRTARRDRVASPAVIAPYPTLRVERKCWAAGDRIVVGIDEVGRGSWAGPVTVAAVVPGDEHLSGVRDSKLLTHDEREVAAARCARGRAASASGTRRTRSATSSA